MKGWIVGLFIIAFLGFVGHVSAGPGDYICGDNYCDPGEYCASDCGASTGSAGYSHYSGYDYCYVTTPYYATVGESVPIQIYYNGLVPYSVEVDCGDGSRTTAYRNGIFGSGTMYNGILYGYCHYNYQGTFFPQAYAGGVYCSGDYITITGSNNPYPTYYPTVRPTAYPTIRPTTTPTPTATPRPNYPNCALSAYPSAIKEGDNSIVSVSYYDLNRQPGTVSVDCGNGATQNAVDCLGTTGSCSVFCNYDAQGTYTAKAIAAGTTCSQATIKVNAQTANKCSDGTVYGTCAATKPKYCDDGFLVDKASICGCADGKVQSGERCITPAGSCSVTLNPQTVRANEQTDVVINYNGIDLQTDPNNPPLPGNSNVQVLCGNGDTETPSCTSNSQLSGTCIASCAYGEESTYPKNYQVKAFVKGVQCSTANVQVTSPSETTGSLLTKVSDCSTGSSLQHAKVSIDSQNDYYTDANGQLKISLDPATYNVEASKENYLPESTTVQITKGKISTANICLQPEGCDVSAVLVTTPASDDARNPLLYQIKITNNLNDQNEVSITYSSAMHIEGDTSIILQGKEARTIDVWVYANARTVGKSAGTVSVKGTGSCTKNIDLPINVVGGLSVEVQEPYKETYGDKRVCYDLLVRNRGKDEGMVSLTYTGNLDADFSENQFYLNSQEIKDGIQFCVSPRNGDSGTYTFNIRALSGISDANAIVNLKVLDTGDFETDVGGSCIYIDSAVESHPIEISNDAADGDYEVVLRNNDANARITPSVLYNFNKGTSRTVYITANPKDVSSGDSIIELVLKRNGEVAMQKEVCLSTNRYHYYYYNGNDYYYYYDNGRYVRRYYSNEISSQLSDDTLDVSKGGSVSTVLTLRNTGDAGNYFSIKVESSIPAKLSESSFYLDAGQEKRITITFNAPSDARPFKYSIPVKIYSGRDSGGVVYNGDSTGSAQIQCGDGRIATLDCPEGSSSCSATCKYSGTGTYTVQGYVGNQKCTNSKIRVVPDDYNSCAISVDSVIAEGTSTRVNVRYYSLTREPTNNEILVYCGNGETRTADNCDGKTGVCSVSCDYDSKGTYTVRASASGNECTSADVKVTDDNTFCSVNTQGIAQEDEITSVNLKYRNVMNNGYNPYGPYYNYRYYSNTGSGTLLKTETITLTVDGGSGTATLTPSNLNPDAVVFTRVLAGDVPSSGTANAVITVKNTRDYKLEDVILLLNGLPAGVKLAQIQPFTLDASTDKNLYFQLEASNAKEGIYKVTAQIRFDGQALEKQFDLKVVPESETVKAELRITDSKYEILEGNQVAKFNFEVINKEDRTLSLSAVIRDLPDNWKVDVLPALAQIKKGETGNFSVNITAKGAEQKTYAGMIELRSTDGRKFTSPIAIEFTKLNPLSGLFAMAGSLGIAQIIAILLILAVGLYVYFSGRRYREEAARMDEEYGEDGRSDRLKGIHDEIGSHKQTTLIDESKFKKKKYKYETPEDFEATFIETDEDSKEDVLTKKDEDDDE